MNGHARGSLHDGFLRVRLETSTYGLHFELHEDERFWDQPHGALGAAVLVAPDLFVTVAHLLPSDLSSLRLVFGYRLVDRATPQTELFTTDVYKITRVVAQGASTPPGRDWALLQVDREVRGRIPVTIRRQGSIAVGARLYTLGHPGGLPLKFSDRARVRSIGANSFVTNLDYATHSSGSPVFNATDHVLEGLISQGERDNFVTCCDGRWRVTYHLEDDEGEGVTCTAASAFARFVP